jgi:CheY-like chemotaxis protein
MRRVLVVDDEPAVRALVAASLETEGWDVTTVEDGVDALLALSDSHPDLILLDVGLPGLSGGEVLRRLRANQSLRSIPVVLLTGAEPPDGLDADAVLSKPFAPAGLRQLCNQLATSPAPSS